MTEYSMIDQREIFGKTNKCFSLQALKELFDNDMRNDTSFTASKKYFLTYYAKSLDGHFYAFCPSEEDDCDGEIHKKAKLTDIFDQIKDVRYFSAENNNPQVFKLKNWFMKNHYQTFNISADPTKDRFYTSEKTGANYINLSKGFLHKERKQFKKFSKSVKDKVQIVLDHIKNVWNSGNEKNFDYTMLWLANALTANKMKTALFMKSGEGTGKSIVVEFLINHVIGHSLGIITQRASSLMKFNYQLLNKILLCLEELPSNSKSQWHSITDYLKDIITNSTMDIEKKFEDVVQIINRISLIIITNNENSIRFGKDIRRYHMCDISHDKVGDTKYFEKLASAMTRDVGEAFFSYLVELKESRPDFTVDTQTPQSNMKLAMKDTNMTPLLKFFKDRYVKFKKGIDKIPVADLARQFNDSNYSFNKMGIKNFHSYLCADIPVVKTKIATKKKTLHTVPMPFETLLQFYKKKGYWDDKFDEFDDNDNTVDFIDHDDIDVITLRQHHEELKRKDTKIQELLEKVKELENKIKPKKKTDKSGIDWEVNQFQDDDEEEEKPKKKTKKKTKTKTKTKTKKTKEMKASVTDLIDEAHNLFA